MQYILLKYFLKQSEKEIQLKTSNSLWLKIIFGKHSLVFISSQYFFLRVDKCSKILLIIYIINYFNNLLFDLHLQRTLLH